MVKEIVLAISIDYDGCLMRRALTLVEWQQAAAQQLHPVIADNINFFEYLLEIIKHEVNSVVKSGSAVKVNLHIMIGSTRQCLQVDLFNSNQKFVFTSQLLKSGSIVPAFLEIEKYINNMLVQEGFLFQIILEKSLLGDIYHNEGPGANFNRIKKFLRGNPYYVYENAQGLIDQDLFLAVANDALVVEHIGRDINKTSLLCWQMHYVAAQYSKNTLIKFYFFDDRLEILNQQADYFLNKELWEKPSDKLSKTPTDMPLNVALYLYQYTNNECLLINKIEPFNNLL